MEPSQTHKRTHSKLNEDTDETRMMDLRLRFKKIHPHDFQSDESFDLFFEDAKEHLVSKYLHDLEQFFSRLPPNVTRDLSWQCFVQGNLMTFASLTKNLSLETNNMKHTAIRLACLRRYPQLYDPSRLDTSTMRRALEAESKEDGRAILEAGPRPVFNSRVSGGVIQKGYQSPYLHSPVIVDPILDTLNEYAIEWNNSIYMGPYAALIGPSTSGKSRLLMETAQHICVVYICLRPKDLPGFPPRSALADFILNTAVTDETYYTSLLACIFQVVANFFSIQHPDGNMTDRLKKWNDYTEVASSGSLDIANPTQEKFTADVVKEMQNFLTGPPANLQKAAKDMANSTKFINSRSSIRVLLALDEARALLQSSIPDNDTFFRIFRGTIHNIPTGMGIFILLVDTTSHVANFSIKSTFDSGGRYKFERENRLYEPIYQIASFDAMVSPDPPQSWGALVSPERLFNQIHSTRPD
ncbi:hypothetical protein MJO28_014881 [Puccinia striiformis f. sp. tritici]|uniref:Uncharacterized protein n=1 Tax=Puccinia striiformis f. sp. tritici TaxID=168172 RepID=A0ACC0DS79_9BASI|nr:hypothetical protein MJO28_014881 [Puccinia striiformis f. sp. tritici]